jgi:hypothetical protein
MTAHYRYNAPHQRYVDAQINARVMKLVDMTDSKSECFFICLVLTL